MLEVDLHVDIVQNEFEFAFSTHFLSLPDILFFTTLLTVSSPVAPLFNGVSDQSAIIPFRVFQLQMLGASPSLC